MVRVDACCVRVVAYDVIKALVFPNKDFFIDLLLKCTAKREPIESIVSQFFKPVRKSEISDRCFSKRQNSIMTSL